jgi:membrane-associated phospholipid phosphatase
MDSLITFVAKYFILISVFATLYVFLKLKGKQRKEMLVMLFCAGLLSLIFAKIGAHLYNDPRPYIKDGSQPLFAHSNDPNGFPSDHTLLASLLGFVTLYYSKKAGFALLFVAALIGWARVAAHVHHAVDIIGSFICTALAYSIVKQLLNSKALTTKVGHESLDQSKNSQPTRRLRG